MATLPLNITAVQCSDKTTQLENCSHQFFALLTTRNHLFRDKYSCIT